jgi:lantibiotic modifying enzyme
MLIEAYMTFKNSDYLDSALKGGKNVWRNGLLKKGFGLCHGTCGNAYALNALYKATGDAIWQQRARMFLLWTGDREVISAVANNDQSGFKIRGVPDTPFSLMEG